MQTRDKIWVWLAVIMSTVCGCAWISILGLGMLGAVTERTEQRTPGKPTILAFLPTATPGLNAQRATATPVPTTTPVSIDPLALKRVSRPMMVAAQKVGPGPFSIGSLAVGPVTDALYVLGEVRNDSREPREQVTVRVVLTDAAGNEVARAEGFPVRSYLKSREAVPFAVIFSAEKRPASYDSYRIEVDGAEATFYPDYTERRFGLVGEPVVRDARLSDARQPWIEITGRVRNDSDRAIQYVQATAVFYDAEGRVVGSAVSFVSADGGSEVLEPGVEGSFEISALVFVGTPTSYQLIVEGSPPASR